MLVEFQFHREHVTSKNTIPATSESLETLRDQPANPGKVKVNVICIVPCCEHTSKALRYGTRSQRISQFYLHTPRSSVNGMNHTCLCLPCRPSNQLCVHMYIIMYKLRHVTLDTHISHCSSTYRMPLYNATVAALTECQWLLAMQQQQQHVTARWRKTWLAS